MEYSNKIRLFLLLIPCSLLLFSCSGKKDKTPSYGNLDFDAIAADTTMQLNFEASYEYVKDHNFKGTLYSVVSGGFTGFENVLVIKRENVTNYDTLAVLKNDSLFRLTESFLSASRNENFPDIHLIYSKTGDTVKQQKKLVFSGEKWSIK